MIRKTAIERYVWILGAIFLSLYGLVLAREFLYPIALAILFTYLVYPISNFLEKKGYPRIGSILISIFLLLLLIALVGHFMYKRTMVLFTDLPHLREQAIANIKAFENYLQNYIGIRDDFLISLIQRKVDGLFEAGNQSMNQALSRLSGLIFTIGIMPVYIFLFLYYRTKFATFILKIVPRHQKLRTINMLRDISTIAGRYMRGVFIVVVIISGLNTAGLYLIGFPYPFIMGILSALFCFIPYFGILIGGSLPALLALLTLTDPSMVLKVIILYLIINSIENNIHTPNIVGDHVRINPFFVIIGLILSALIWGIPGMIVVIPFLAMFKIVMGHIKKYEAIDYLLDNRGTRRHAITWENFKAFRENMKKNSQKWLNWFR